MVDPTVFWGPWVDEDVRHAALHAAFDASAFDASAGAEKVSFMQLCGALCDLGMMHELIAQEMKSFLRNFLLMNSADDLVLPEDDEQHLDFEQAELLFNAAVQFQSGWMYEPHHSKY